MAQVGQNSLHEHVTAVKKGERVFENAFQSVTRMILEKDIDKVIVNGKSTFDYTIFRAGDKHIIGMFDEINSFVSFIKDASQGGSSKEMAFVLVGEPGNGKTFLVEYLCGMYRTFLSQPQNRRYTFRFTGMGQFGHYGNIDVIESQTYEDPMVLAMNLMETPEESQAHLARRYRLTDEVASQWWDNYRPLGACSAYIWNDIR
ncbi:MAG: serine protein kinase PrkA, partial [Desulfobacterales bacterium]|nr:serine protein kinase PrkA [Desulfobacterales bacterium]